MSYLFRAYFVSIVSKTRYFWPHHNHKLYTETSLSIMAILTLTSDWGLRDHYLASFKGLLISRIPTISLIDISHDIEDYNTIEAAYIVQHAFNKFPPGTIHFIAVSNSENCTGKNPYVLIRHMGHYLLGEDNGIFSLITGQAEKEILRLPLDVGLSRKNLYEAFAEVIKRVTEGEFESLGLAESKIIESFLPQASVDRISIRGTIIFIDSFGNAILNVSKQLFEKEKGLRTFSIQFRKAQYEVTEISNNYCDVENGEMVAFFNQDDFLEIALNRDSASKLLGLKIMDPVRIEFDDNKVG